MASENDPGSGSPVQHSTSTPRGRFPGTQSKSASGTNPAGQRPAESRSSETGSSPPSTLQAMRAAPPASRTRPSPALKQKQSPSRFRRKRWIAVFVVLLLAAVFLQVRSRRHTSGAPLAGYLADVPTLEREYSRYYGKPLSNPEIESQFKEAAALMLQREFARAAGVLEAAARQAAVPVVFNNLGVLYAELNDRGRAVYAFREGLARDGSYGPVRANFIRYKELIADDAEPLTREIEPNDTTPLANPISLDKPVEASIASTTRDIDIFRFNAPPSPRDILALEFSNRSATLIPIVTVYDSDDRDVELERPESAAGTSFTKYFSQAPNATLFVKVSGSRDTAGSYFLTIKPLKAFDAFEPDDDIFNAHPVVVGQPVEANIMDSRDTDYYSFVAPRTGQVTIEIKNGSTTLIPALTTFHPDRRNSGFGPDLKTPGADLHHRFDVQQNQTYYLQVWSQASSSGKYTLTVN